MSFSTPRPPLDRGYLPFDDLAVIFGGNDVGKTHLLRLVRDELAAKRMPPAAPLAEEATRSVFFCECTRFEADFLIGHVLADLAVDLDETETEEPEIDAEQAAVMLDLWGMTPLSGEREAWELGGWRDGLCELAVESNSRAGFISALEAAAGGEAATWGVLLPKLAESDLLAFEAVYDQSRSEWVWRIYWCLPPFSRLDQTLQKALGEVGLLAFPGERPLPSANDEEASREESLRAATLARVRHLTVESAPIMLAPLGRAALSILPVPILVPSDFESLRQQAEELIDQTVAHIRWGPEDGVAVYFEDVAPHREVHASSTWLEITEEGLAARLHPCASGCATALARRVNDMLPPFVHDHYTVEFEIRALAEWSSGNKLALVLNETHPETGQTTGFPIAEGASGLHLWLQLALLEAMQSLRQLLPLMQLKLDEWTSAEGQHQDIVYLQESGEDHDVEPQLTAEEADALQAALRAEWQPFADAISNGILPEGVEPDLESMATSMKPVVVGHVQRRLLALTAKRLYIIDEPERHLHPRLQLQLAPWLANTVRNGTSQAIIATHSVPFLNAGADTFVHVRRPRGERTVVAGAQGAELPALSAIALELGLDRGQLLASVGVLLYVEGSADQAVLKVLVGDELRQCGVKVVPLHGEARARGILDADLTLRITSAAPVLWLDNLPADVVELLMNDPASAGSLARGAKSPEVRTAAKLVERAHANGRRVELIPHPGTDIFDLLDEHTLKDLFHDFPGHREARAAARKAREQSGIRAKDFYEKAYGIASDVDTFKHITGEMKKRRVPLDEAFLRLVATCRRLSVTTPGPLG